MPWQQPFLTMARGRMTSSGIFSQPIWKFSRLLWVWGPSIYLWVPGLDPWYPLRFDTWLPSLFLGRLAMEEGFRILDLSVYILKGGATKTISSDDAVFDGKLAEVVEGYREV